MKIRIIGAGPAGLYFAALMKQDDPAHDIVIHERGARGATSGFGVVLRQNRARTGRHRSGQAGPIGSELHDD